MSDAETRADLLQQADLDVDEIEALVMLGGPMSRDQAYAVAERLFKSIVRIPLSDEKADLLAGGVDALLHAIEDVCNERLMASRFCKLVRELLEDCVND